jgi:hypothetical protein
MGEKKRREQLRKQQTYCELVGTPREVAKAAELRHRVLASRAAILCQLSGDMRWMADALSNYLEHEPRASWWISKEGLTYRIMLCYVLSNIVRSGGNLKAGTVAGIWFLSDEEYEPAYIIGRCEEIEAHTHPQSGSLTL